jgi:ribose transport system substrate-binding protein
MMSFETYKHLYAQQDGQCHPRRSTIHPKFFCGPAHIGNGWRWLPREISPEWEGTMKLMKGLALSLAALAVVLIPGCGARHSPKEVFYLVAANMSTNYWQTAVAGFKKAGAEYGVTARTVGPDKYDPQAELAELQAAVAAKPAGILISVADAAVLTPGINAAVDAGIPVITIDSDADSSHRLYFIGTNNLDAGRLGGRRVVEKLGGKGNVVFFTITGQPNTEERLKGFKDAFATRPGINIVEVVDIKGETTVAFDRAQQYLAQTGAKKIDAFICLESASGELVAEAVKRSHDTTRTVVAWDVNPDTLQVPDGIRRPESAGRDLSLSTGATGKGLELRRVRALSGVYRYRNVAGG